MDVTSIKSKGSSDGGVRNEVDYFNDVPDEKIPKDMLDLASHIVETKAAHFDPSKFDDRYEDEAWRRATRADLRKQKLANLPRGASPNSRSGKRQSAQADLSRQSALDHPRHRSEACRWWYRPTGLQQRNGVPEFDQQCAPGLMFAVAA
jgi:hypothetical protein